MTPSPPVAPAPVIQRAYAACEELARSHYENFPVASVLLPRRARPAVAAIYAFARRADDFADEPGYAEAERLRLLDDWQERLRHAAAGRATGQVDPSETDLVFIAVGDAIRRHRLPPALLEALLSAFRQDVTVRRYDTWDQVLDYCSRSANPVGRLVLRVAGYDDPALDRASDALCTALQLTNFWQDFARDWGAGRLYVPREDCRRTGALEADLDAGVLTPAWREALQTAGARTASLFEQGRPVCDGVRGRLRYELRLTWLGGRRILERLEATGYDVFRERPVLSRRDALPLLWRSVRWRAV